MNTIAHITAMVAALYGAVYSVETLQISPLGFVFVGVFAVFFVMTFGAIADDWKMLKRWGGRQDE